MSLSEKRVVVIGGSSGIGFAVAKLSADEGDHIVIASSNLQRAQAAADRINGDTEAIQLDVTNESAIHEFFANVGTFDHLAYTAGERLLLKPLAELTTAEARAFFEIRYWGAFAAAKHAIGHINDTGSIVLTSGGVATRPAPGTTVPASTTGAVESLVRSLALDLAPVRVNAVRPGVIRTELWDETIPEPDTFYGSVGNQLPVQRVGEPAEAAAAYIYVMNNAYATGTVLAIDGGQALV
jgi:NAD(P)-dependent dehydrogenase (short-subunit alcohol dehydrogenase family)